MNDEVDINSDEFDDFLQKMKQWFFDTLCELVLDKKIDIDNIKI